MYGSHYMVRLLLGLTLLSFLACGKKSSDCAAVFFGGEIVNPTSDYVVLYRNDVYVDSVKLDNNNRFSFDLEGIEEGLYHFDHTPELQYVYLQGGDSLLVRLNTLEFDESLVFSGKGSEINNFLIEMFLTYENEEPLIYDLYELDPDSFDQKIDSLKTLKIAHLKELETDNGQFTGKELAMAKAAIDYNSYLYKEKYPFYHKKRTGEETVHELGSSFYEYRKNLNLNNKDLTYFRPYFDFMKWHFGNLSYMTCMEDCHTGKAPISDRLHFNNHKLHLVDSLVQEQELRDILFRNIAVDYLLKEHNPSEECRVFIDKFRSLSSNDDHKKEIDALYSGIKSLQPNNSLPDIVVRDVDDNEVYLKDVVSKKKNTVFYFWTADQKGHFKNITQRIALLEKKHPEYNFVGINLKTSHTQWVNMLEEFHLDKTNQYHGEDFKEIQMAMIVDGLNKCVITKDTLIVNAFGNLYASF
ncbi:transaldolase [Flagellimonas olearia]|uniref:Transaldolase n=2 Tax=Flagellimonas olearia TaxID=552546 RepID=A0A6I1DZH5_9FLAO|nr:transaldolase [Allomuricauda olearia]